MEKSLITAAEGAKGSSERLFALQINLARSTDFESDVSVSLGRAEALTPKLASSRPARKRAAAHGAAHCTPLKSVAASKVRLTEL